jgi:hypothetical protein
MEKGTVARERGRSLRAFIGKGRVSLLQRMARVKTRRAARAV